MTAVSNAVSSRRRYFSPGVLFSVILLAVTVIPFLGILIAPTYPVVAPTIDFLLILGSTHIFATTYLLTDPVIRRFVVNNPVKMIIIPAVMVIGGALLIGVPGTPIFVPAVLIFFLYQT